MADNITLNSGSGGQKVATDDDATAHHQYVKVEYGPDNTQTKVTTTSGLPVLPDTTAGVWAIYADNDSWTDTTSNHILTGGLYQSTPQTVTDGRVAPFQIDSNGRLLVSAAAGSAEVTIGSDTYSEASSAGVNITAVRNNDLATLADTDNEFAPLQVNENGALYATTVVSDNGGTTYYRNIDLDEDAADQIKGGQGQLYWVHAMNQSSSVLYLHFYDESGAITVGTTTPKMTFVLPTQGDTNGAGFVLSVPNGIAFTNSIKCAATNNISTAGTALSANDVVLNAGYA